MPENFPPDYELAALKNAVRGQVTQTPPAFVRSQVMEKIHLTQPVRPKLQWAIGMVLGLIIFAMLWRIVQPGIVIQWVWKQGDVKIFQVYRALEGSDQFAYLSEISAQTALTEYTFVDPLLIPGQNYTYRIVGFDTEGISILDQMVTESSLAALPGQIALIVASLMIAIGLLPELERLAFRKTMKSEIFV